MENTFFSPKKIFLPIQPLIFSFDFSSIFIFHYAHNEPKFRIQITRKTFSVVFTLVKSFLSVFFAGDAQHLTDKKL